MGVSLVFYIQKAFLVLSNILIILSTFITGKASRDLMISGYSFLLFSISIISIFIIKSTIERFTDNSGEVEKMSQMMLSILYRTFPLLLLIGNVSFLIYQSVKFGDLIINGNLPKEYYTMSKVSAILSAMITGGLTYAMNGEKFMKTKILSQKYNGAMYIISFFVTCATIAMYIILRYFVTDGYKNIKN